MDQNTWEIEAFTIKKLEQGLYLLKVKHVGITLENYKEMLLKVATIKEPDNKVDVIVDLDNIGMLNRDAALYAKNNAGKIFKRIAFVASSPVAKMVISFFLQITRPQFTNKTFKDYESAKEWLSS